MLKEYFLIAINSLRRRKIRSWLTTIGIVIGIAAIVSMMTLGQGMENAIEDAFESFGQDVVLIQGGADFAPPAPGEYGLTKDDIKTVEKVAGVDYVLEALYETSKIEFHNEELYTFVIGYDPEKFVDFFSKSDFDVEQGRAIRKGETGAVIIGTRVVDDLFEDNIGLKNRIKIEDKTFKVVGILAEIGNSQDDSSIIVSLDDARDLFNEQDGVTMMMAIAKPGINMEKLGEDIQKELEDARNDENFQVFSTTQLLEQITGILAIIRLVLVGIAAIALVVGTVGIMNTMYMSVLERTKEIGIMKSIGATNGAILTIFLLESAIFGIVGGIIGTIIGVGISLGVGYAIEIADIGIPFIVIIRPSIIAFGIGFSAIMGVVSGILPARNASKLKPVDALRHE